MTSDIDAILRQRAELKRRDPEAILLFRVEDEHGDYCYAYQDDAARLTGIIPVETRGIRYRGSKPATLRISPEALDTVLDRIVRAGKRAAVCEPYRGPKPPRAAVERVVTEGRLVEEDAPKHTPGP